jgi:secreted trypsin-like serine protease
MKQFLVFLALLIAFANAYPEDYVSSNKLRVGRIIGGTKAILGEFPYQAGLFKNSLLYCGGSVISDVVILTVKL